MSARTLAAAADDWRDWEPIYQQWSATGAPVARDDTECAGLDHPPNCSNPQAQRGGRCFCRCGAVSQPGMHGGVSPLGYHLRWGTTAPWTFGADGHVDLPGRAS